MKTNTASWPLEKNTCPVLSAEALGDAPLRPVAEAAQVERGGSLLRERGGVLEVGVEARLVRRRIPLDLLIEHVELPGREHEDAEVRDRRRVDGRIPCRRETFPTRSEARSASGLRLGPPGGGPAFCLGTLTGLA